MRIAVWALGLTLAGLLAIGVFTITARNDPDSRPTVHQVMDPVSHADYEFHRSIAHAK